MFEIIIIVAIMKLYLLNSIGS